jgi:hypothetical protein
MQTIRRLSSGNYFKALSSFGRPSVTGHNLRRAFCATANCQRDSQEITKQHRDITPMDNFNAAQINDKASLKVWKDFMRHNLAKLEPNRNPLEVLGLDFSQSTLNSPSNYPDYVYSTAINELVAREYLTEAYSLVIKAHLEGQPLEIGTFENLMREMVEQKFDGSYIVNLYRMLACWFVPNASILKHLRETQVIQGQTRLNGLQFVRDELLKQGVDLEGHETHGTQTAEDSKTEAAVKDEVIKTLSSKLKKGEGSHLVAPSLGKDDQHKFAQLYNQVSQLVSDAKFVVVMPSSFDLKDADGNILMSVDNAKYDDDYDSQESDYSQSQEEVSDPEEESNSNKKR